MRLSVISQNIIGAAVEIHRVLGPGLPEPVYEECLALELAAGGLRFERQVPLAVTYRGRQLRSGYRLDLLIEGQIAVALTATNAIAPLRRAQLLTCLRLAQCPLGLLFNFNQPVLHDGIERIVNKFSAEVCLNGG